MKAADVGDDVFGSCSRLRVGTREWGGEGRNMTKGSKKDKIMWT
jgi:hypothetical protein